MKVFQLAALFGGVVSAVKPLVGRDDGTTTMVVYTTSTYTITKCAASVTNCPVASATEVFTSTTVMSVTTTICPVSSTPGLQPPESGYLPSSALSSALPTISSGTSDNLSEAVPTSYPPGISAPSSAYMPPVQSSALPTGPSRSIDFSVSLISPSPSLPVTGTDSIPTSFPPDASGPSSAYTPSAQTSAQPTVSSSPDTVIVPRPTPSGLVSLPGSLTNSIPTSFPPGASVSGSSMGYIPPQPLTTAGPISSLPTTVTNTDAVPTSASSGYGQSSGPSNTATDAIPTFGYPISSASPSTGVYSPSASSNTDTAPTSAYSGSTVVSSGSTSPTGSSYTATGVVPTSGYAGPGASASNGANSRSLSTNTATDAVPTSGNIAPNASPSSDINATSSSSNTATDAVPTSGYTSASSPTSSGTNSPSLSTNTATDAVPTSGYPDSSASPSSSTNSSSSSNTATDAVPTSGYLVSSVRGSASSSGTVGTNTDSVPTSPGPVASGPSSSGYATPGTTALPAQGTSSTAEAYPSESAPVVSSSTLSTVSGTYPAVTSDSSSMVYPEPPPPASTTVIDGTTRITSRLILTSTNYITGPSPSSNPFTDTATDAAPTSHGTGYIPSGSGYPYPSGSANGTVVAPTPSYIEVPVNMGQIVAVGQSPFAAIVIALVFALFA